MKKKDFTTNFDWGLYPKTERFLQKEITNFLRNSKFAGKLSKLMWDRTSTHMIDWIDHMVLPENRVKEPIIKKLGFKSF